MKNRRSFLRILSASPLAIKASADKAISDLAGISNANSMAPMTPMASYGATAAGENSSWKRKVLSFVAKNTLPEWFDDELRRRYQTVTYLDPDIAAKRTWSMCVKIATQRERNIERGRREAVEGPMRQLRHSEFSEQFGVYL